MELKDPENVVPVPGHKGPHPQEYHQRVYQRLEAATRNCRGISECRSALTEELRVLAEEASTPGTLLNRLLTEGKQP